MFFPSERAGNPSLLWSYLMPDPSGSGGGRGHQKALWCFSPIGELILSNLRRNAASLLMGVMLQRAEQIGAR